MPDNASDNVSASATLTATPPTDGISPGAAPAAPAATPAAPAAPASTWYNAADPDVKAYVENKGWKEPADLLKSYQNLEKLFGADKQGRTLQVPDWNDKSQVEALYEKLGRPKMADDYQLALGEKADPEFAKWAKGTFHELGLSNSQAKALSEKWGEFAGGVEKVQTAAKQAAAAQQIQALDQEWGAAKEANTRMAQKAVKTFGLTGDAIDALQDTMGYDGVMKFLHGLGSKLGEGDFVDGQNKPSAPMSPNQAQAAFKTLMANPEFMAAILDPRNPKHEWAKAEKAKVSAYMAGVAP